MKGVPNEKFGLDGERSAWLEGTVTKVTERTSFKRSISLGRKVLSTMQDHLEFGEGELSDIDC